MYIMVLEPIAGSHDCPAILSMVISVSICHRFDGAYLSTQNMILLQSDDFSSFEATI